MTDIKTIYTLGTSTRSTEDFFSALKTYQINCIKKLSTVLICAERLPWKCHRFKISHGLIERGWNVVHVIERDRIWQPDDVAGRG